MSNIHKTAIIEDGAILGENVTVGAYTMPLVCQMIFAIDCTPKLHHSKRHTSLRLVLFRLKGGFGLKKIINLLKGLCLPNLLGEFRAFFALLTLHSKDFTQEQTILTSIHSQATLICDEELGSGLLQRHWGRCPVPYKYVFQGSQRGARISTQVLEAGSARHTRRFTSE